MRATSPSAARLSRLAADLADPLLHLALEALHEEADLNLLPHGERLVDLGQGRALQLLLFQFRAFEQIERIAELVVRRALLHPAAQRAQSFALRPAGCAFGLLELMHLRQPRVE